MHSDAVARHWKETKERLRHRWSRLTDDDLESIGGRTEDLAGVLRRRYGLARELAEQDSRTFLDECNAEPDAPVGHG